MIIAVVCVNAGMFESRILEYREEMTEFSSSLRQNVKNVGKKIKEFIVESGQFHVHALTDQCMDALLPLNFVSDCLILSVMGTFNYIRMAQIDTSYLVDGLIVASARPRMAKHPLNGRGQVTWTI